MSYAVLIVEDEPALARNIGAYLANAGYEIKIAGTSEDALRHMEKFKPDAVLLDFNLPGIDGLKAIGMMRALDAQVRIIMLTGHASVELAVDAMKAGAYDFLTKPVSLSRLRILLDKLTQEERQSEALAYYRSRDARNSGLDKLLGECGSMQGLREKVSQVIRGDEILQDGDPPAVLIVGETGTGKELVARALHFGGPRRDRPFVEINCASIPTQLLESELFGYERGAFTDAKSRKLGLFETADGGTLFLDEIGDMELLLQTKLLRVLEEKSVRRLGSLRDQKINVRIIAATHQPLEKLVSERRFRADLLFRIRMVHLAIPALRDRDADVMLLARHYLGLHAQRYGKSGLQLSPEVQRALLAHRWPGNVRELRNVMEQAVLMASGPVVESVDLDWFFAAGTSTAPCTEDTGSQTLNLAAVERDTLTRALQATHGNVTRAARLLGVTRDTLRYRMEKFDMAAPSQQDS